MFVDKARIHIKAGNGGNGRVSFHTEKYIPNGGPDGGDGGKGGDIIFVATNSQNTLNDYYYRRHYKAGNGEPGDISNSYGRQGEDLILKVPVGTVIKDFESQKIIADMYEDGMRIVAIHGGRGGKGNAHFANSRHQTPRFAQNGEASYDREIELELKTIADVGLVGFPNVGKSTLLSVISNARPKIANYHFTTLNPNLGVVARYEKTFVVADIPGLIEGASDGLGLGHEFLKHIERTRMIIHCLDISGSEDRDPLEDFEIINKELKSYSEVLANLPMIVCANKMDMPNSEINIKRFIEKYGDKYKVFETTTIIHEGLDKLLNEVLKMLEVLPKTEPVSYEPFILDKVDLNEFEIYIDDGVYYIEGSLVDNLGRRVLLSDPDSFRYFQNKLKELGIIDKLKEMGVKENDVVVFGDIEFEFVE